MTDEERSARKREADLRRYYAKMQMLKADPENYKAWAAKKQELARMRYWQNADASRAKNRAKQNRWHAKRRLEHPKAAREPLPKKSAIVRTKVQRPRMTDEERRAKLRAYSRRYRQQLQADPERWAAVKARRNARERPKNQERWKRYKAKRALTLSYADKERFNAADRKRRHKKNPAKGWRKRPHAAPVGCSGAEIRDSFLNVVTQWQLDNPHYVTEINGRMVRETLRDPLPRW